MQKQILRLEFVEEDFSSVNQRKISVCLNYRFFNDQIAPSHNKIED